MELGGGVSEHTQTQKKEYIQTKPHEVQLPVALQGILTQKMKTSPSTFLSSESLT